MELNCPKCQSDDVRRLSLIHKAGASTFEAATSAIGIGGGGEGFLGGLVGASTSGRQRTKLSQEAAPPRRRELSTFEFACLIVGAIMIFVNLSSVANPSGPNLWFIIGIAGVANGGLRLYRVVKWNRDEHPALQKRWEDSFMCMRCGDVFVPAAALVQEKSLATSNQTQSGTGRSHAPQDRPNEFLSLRPTLLSTQLAVFGLVAIILVVVVMLVGSLDVSGTPPSDDVNRVQRNPRQAPALSSSDNAGKQEDEAKWDAMTASDLARRPNMNRQWSRLLSNRKWEMSQEGQVERMWLSIDGSGRFESRDEASAIRWYAFSRSSVRGFEFCTVLQPRSYIVACGVAQIESTYMDIGANAGKWYYTLSWSQGNEVAPPYEFVSCCSGKPNRD